MGTIYIFRNKINGKPYVGQTGDFGVRFRGHKNGSLLIDKAIRKYGLKNFEKLLIENVPEKELDYWERHYIQECNSISPNGYNLESGGHKHKHHCEETKKQMSKSQKRIGSKPPSWAGKRHQEETKKKMSEARMGWHPSKETKKKMSIAKRLMTQETKRKMSEAKMGKNRPLHSEETKQKMREIRIAWWVRKRGDNAQSY